MNTAKQLQSFYTIDDIYSLPEGKRAELIYGELYLMSAPGTKHQEIVMELSYQIRHYIGASKGFCKVYPAPFAVFLNGNDEIYLEPDISVICDKTKVTEEGCIGAPDWIIEIVSPSSRSWDYNKKLFLYRASGVREYWIVDPLKNCVSVYSFERDEMEEYTFSDKVGVGIYDGFEIDHSQMEH